jgi:hypothetical protein
MRYYIAYLDLIDSDIDIPQPGDSEVLTEPRTWVWWEDRDKGIYQLPVPGVCRAYTQVDQLLDAAKAAAVPDDWHVAIVEGRDQEEVTVHTLDQQLPQVISMHALGYLEPGQHLVTPTKLIRWETLTNLRDYVALEPADDRLDYYYWAHLVNVKAALAKGTELPPPGVPVPECLVSWIMADGWDDEPYWLSPEEASEALSWLSLQMGYEPSAVLLRRG